MELAAVLSGFLTGIIVGMTGVGGGAIMTPILILVLGIAPTTAVGTDLLFATITKMVAVRIHGSNQTIDWQIVRRLSLGSLPAAAATVLALRFFVLDKSVTDFIMLALGAALILTAIAMLAKGRLHEVGRNWRIASAADFKRWQPGLTVSAGVVLGVMVTLTSIGAGALGTVLLVYLYPLRLNSAKLVGTDLAHAVPLALIAGVGHLFLGNVDWVLLGWLLVGSLPGVWIGSNLSAKAPDKVIRSALAVILLLVGLYVLA